jgi:hypothetical protein
VKTCAIGSREVQAKSNKADEKRSLGLQEGRRPSGAGWIEYFMDGSDQWQGISA